MGGQHRGQVLGGQLALLHMEKRPHHNADHVVKKPIGGYGENHQIPPPLHPGGGNRAAQVALFPLVQGAERGEVVAAQVGFGSPVQQGLVDGVPVMEGPALPKGIPDRVIPDFIAILLALAAVAGVEVLWYRAAGFYGNVRGKVVV